MGCGSSKAKLVPMKMECSFKDLQSDIITPISIPPPQNKSRSQSVSSVASSFCFVDPKIPDHPGQLVIGESGTKEIRGSEANFTIEFACLSLTGYYPEQLDKHNQDSYICFADYDQVSDNNGNEINLGLFGVFDGHGIYGDKCSQFSSHIFPKKIKHNPSYKSDFLRAFKEAFIGTNESLHKRKEMKGEKNIDDSFSGTTAICLMLYGSEAFIGNVGDSRAIAGVKSENGKVEAVLLSVDQTPYRNDELLRVQLAGAQILSLEEKKNDISKSNVNWAKVVEGNGDPPRLWAKDENYPGVCFTRSIGDSEGEKIGVVAVPEIQVHTITADDEYIVICSDGVFEFLTSQQVIDITSSSKTVMESCQKLLVESHNLWLTNDVRTDDITALVIKISNYNQTGEISSRSRHESELSQNLRPVRGTLYSSVKNDNNKNGMGPVQPLTVEEQNYQLPAVYTGLPSQKNDIKEAIKSQYIFRYLDDDTLNGLVNSVVVINVMANETIIKQGERGDHFYIAFSGEYSVYIKNKNITNNTTKNDDNLINSENDISHKISPTSPKENNNNNNTSFVIDSSTPKNVAICVHNYNADHGVYPSFGELALLYDSPRMATIIADSMGVLFVINRNAFRYVVLNNNYNKALHVLRSVKLFHCLTSIQLRDLSKCLNEISYKDGEYITKQGEKCENFYIISQGEVRITKNIKNGIVNEMEITRVSQYGYFGELGLIENIVNKFNTVANGEVKLLKLTKEAFEKVLGSMQDLLIVDKEKQDEQLRKKQIWMDFKSNNNILSVKNSDFDYNIYNKMCNTNLSDYYIIKHVESGKEFTIRRMKIEGIDEKNFQNRIIREKSILNQYFILNLNENPFFISSLKSVNYVNIIYNTLVVNVVSSLIKDKPVSSKIAKYIMSSLILYFEKFHSIDLLFRGVNSSLLCLDNEGKIMITEYTNSKICNGRSFTICVENVYMSPRMVIGQGHDYRSDLWSLGIFLYELLTLKTPFNRKNETDLGIFHNILNHEKDLKKVDGINDKEMNLINKFLKRNPSERIGAGSDGIKNLKNDKYFEDIDFEKLMCGSLESPLKDYCNKLYEKYKSEGKSDEILEMKEYEGNSPWVVQF